MTASPAEYVAGPQAIGKRITVILIPTAESDLRRLQERTNLSQTDLTNRAITLYEFFDAQLRADHELISRDKRTGKTQLVRLLDAPEGQATSAGPALARRGPAGLQRRLGRHRRIHPSPSRPALTGRLLLLAGLTGQEGTQ